ncbi:MAG: acetolactate synthase small subunit [Eubacteriaceae bacterium]|jgi:acetolactate synthase-1/3 small subunit|uniref:Acetolactate synthase small subunit n=1 Tax=Candidatus Pseudoramibacter fermentans TaxID=2594427 RepID=A0A6L5GPC4_9FIRM|nr:acetolactate synthase small subunit [Candidatus Pseudoramibacter fermentans]RRF91747.1 MAG: acetolactate synthase small subunit [Eubacteriaceae bacterium]
MEEKHCLSLIVENKFGVLTRISALFARRGYNIDSLTVGMTEDEEISRITMVVTADEQTLEQIKKQLNKLINVIKVTELKKEGSIARELVFIKVKADGRTRSNIVEISNLFRAHVIDVSKESLILQITGTPSKTKAFMNMIEPYGIIEFVRSGVTGLQRGHQNA